MTIERPASLLAQPSYLAAQVSKYGRRHLEQVLSEHDLALIHDAVLHALRDLGPQAQQGLAEALDIHKSRLVAPIDELEARGLLRRSRDRADRRRNEVALTAAGKALVEELEPAARTSQQGFLDALSRQEQKTLITLLRRVLDANDAARLGDPSESGRRQGSRKRT